MHLTCAHIHTAGVSVSAVFPNKHEEKCLLACSSLQLPAIKKTDFQVHVFFAFLCCNLLKKCAIPLIILPLSESKCLCIFCKSVCAFPLKLNLSAPWKIRNILQASVYTSPAIRMNQITEVRLWSRESQEL